MLACEPLCTRVASSTAGTMREATRPMALTLPLQGTNTVASPCASEKIALVNMPPAGPRFWNLGSPDRLDDFYLASIVSFGNLTVRVTE